MAGIMWVSATRPTASRGEKLWLILADCSNVFKAVKRTAVLTGVGTCVPVLTPVVAKCYGERFAPMFFQMDSGERRKIDCSSGAPQGDAVGPALFCMPLLPVLNRTPEEFEPKGVEAFAYLDEVSIGMVEVTSDTVGVVPFLQRAGHRRYCHEPEQKRGPCLQRGKYRRWTQLPCLKALMSASRNGVG